MLETPERSHAPYSLKCKLRTAALLLAFSCAMSPFNRVLSYDLAASDMAAYRSDVVRRVFDAVKNSPEYKRTVILLTITALGKITSCKVVKGSGNADLDVAMMKALSEVNLQPMRFASSSADTMLIQMCFANSVPDPKNLYVYKNESFQYRSFGNLMQIAGPNETAVISRNPQVRTISRPGAIRTASGDSIQAFGPDNTSDSGDYSVTDRNYDAEIKKLLDAAPPELMFEALQYGLNQVPESSVQLEKSTELASQKHYLAAAQACILALPEPYKSGDTEAVRTILEQLSKLSVNLKNNERFNISMSLVNFCERIQSRMPFAATEIQAKNASSINSILATAQQFLEDSSSKRLGRIALYYQARGKTYQQIGNVDKAKVSYQKYLSMMLENDDAQPSEIEIAFDTAVNFLASQDDKNALQEVENQRIVWESKHPDPTNLFAINSACKRLEMALRQDSAATTDQIVERILKLISSSTLSTRDQTDSDIASSGGEGNSRSRNRNDILSRTLQELARANMQLINRDRRNLPSELTERMVKETFKLAVRTHNSHQQQAFQQLADYLTANSKAQEALVLCDLMEPLDVEENTLVQRARANTEQQLRLKALRALGRTHEAQQVEALIKTNLETRTQSNIRRNITVAEDRLAKTLPYSSERIQARTQLVANLLSQPNPDVTRIKENFLASVREVLSDQFPAYAMGEYLDISNQLSSILTKTEPDLEFTSRAVEGLLQMQYRRTAKSHVTEAQFGRAMPLATILNNASLERSPKTHLSLIRNLVKFCDEQHIQDDTNKLILLRKQADLENKLSDTAGATKTNLAIVTILEKNKDVNKADLVRQLLALARAEATENKITAARKHERQAAQLKFESADSASTSVRLSELSDAYAARGELRDASNSLLDAVKLPKSLPALKHTISARKFVQACAKHKQMSLAKDFLKSAIAIEKSKNTDSAKCNMYRFEFANMLLEESVACKTPSSRDSLLKESEQVFIVAADDISKTQGADAKALGQEVQRRAFLLTLNDMKDSAEALLDKYKAAALNAGGGTLTLDTNVGTPTGPPIPNLPTIPTDSQIFQ